MIEFFTCFHNLSLHLNRHFFLIPFRWQIRQILLYQHFCKNIKLFLHNLLVHCVVCNNVSNEYGWAWASNFEFGISKAKFTVIFYFSFLFFLWILTVHISLHSDSDIVLYLDRVTFHHICLIRFLVSFSKWNTDSVQEHWMEIIFCNAQQHQMKFHHFPSCLPSLSYECQKWCYSFNHKVWSSFSAINSNDESKYLWMINLYPQHWSEPSISPIPSPLQ